MATENSKSISPSPPKAHDSFYHLNGTLPHPLACGGMACFAARYQNPGLYQKARSQHPRVYCLGNCFAAPSDETCGFRPAFKSVSSKVVVLENLVKGPARTLEEYKKRGGYEALKKVLGKPPEETLREVEVSELRGRGGAGFSTGRKWRMAAQAEGAEKFVVANADEGDPGAYIDKYLMEDDPHRLIEAMAVAAYAVGAGKGVIYLRKEYPEAHQILLEAIDEAHNVHLLGKNIFRSGFSFELSVFEGQGSYVCGEETALLNSMEGKRPEPRVRPPYATQSGLFGKPTLVNNVETFAAIPWIILNGASTYQSLGFSKSRGTKVVSLNSLFKHPGLYEVEFGMPVREIVEKLGGGLAEGTLWGVMIGGPLAGLLPPGLLDTPFGFEELQAVGAAVGHGGIVAFNEKTSLAELVHHVFSFGAFESCGKCTPCRLGTRRIEEIFTEPMEGLKAPAESLTEFKRLTELLHSASFCGFGVGLGDFARSVLAHYAKELEKCFR